MHIQDPSVLPNAIMSALLVPLRSTSEAKIKKEKKYQELNRFSTPIDLIKLGHVG